jgi:hypothetical protein
MAHIYRLADKALIWLGGDEYSGSEVAALLHEVNERISNQLSDCGSCNDLQPANVDDPYFQGKTGLSQQGFCLPIVHSRLSDPRGRHREQSVGFVRKQ